jgi:signal transduction histidine kinase
MWFKSPLKFGSLKLHTKTTIFISAVLIAVFAVIAYFYDEFTTQISTARESAWAELMAHRVADTVEFHIKKERKKEKDASQDEESFNWNEVEEYIRETVMKSKPGPPGLMNNPSPSEVRVFFLEPAGWQEKVRLPVDAGPPFLRPPFYNPARAGNRLRAGPSGPGNPGTSSSGQEDESSGILLTAEQGHLRLVSAMARVFSPVDSGGAREIVDVTVLLAFDETTTVAAKLRRLVWPLMALAIIAITLITYVLFRRVIYRPIDKLLVGISRAEGGDLAAEVEPATSDEIGMLTSRFNRMLGKIRAMTDQLSSHQRRLEERVSEATAEIAERKEQVEDANLQLFEMQRQLTQLERLAGAGQLAAQFAHEVGTPLNLISGHVQLLRVRTTDERVIKRLDVIAGQIERITSIVRSMLDSTRKPKPQFEQVDINGLLARILDATQPTLAARGVELSMNMAEGLATIEADPDQLQQVFINLINNSIDAMPGGGVLTISTLGAEGGVEIRLADSGEGIRRDDIDLIFDPLFTTKRGLGTGLGLTIVKQIIADHGGAIEVESEPGSGATFRITLPISAQQAPGSGTYKPEGFGAPAMQVGETKIKA